jgi:OOP family OmpA-OmpF porin
VKWRLEAWRSGSSFADVVLKHTIVFRVEHVFLIHRKTGLLLEHVAAAEAASQDPHMVSGMLSAIQDFVRDSFSNSEGGRGGGIDSLRLGDLTLWCEEGPSAFLAAVIRGNPPESLHTQLREALGHIHEDLRGPLEQFEGDSSILGDLSTRLGTCLQQQEQPKEKKLSRWLWFLPLAVLVGLVTWWVLRAVEESRVDTYVQLLKDQPGIVVTGVERRDGMWHVSGVCAIRWPPIRPTCWAMRTWVPIASPVTGSPIRRSIRPSCSSGWRQRSTRRPAFRW